jgi:hypothetical protein
MLSFYSTLGKQRDVIIDSNVGPTIMVYFSFLSLHVWAVAG